MFAELERVMDMATDQGSFEVILSANVFGKKSADGIKKTVSYLKRLYHFDLNKPVFKAFQHFWQAANTEDKPLLAFLYAIQSDGLLAESIQVVRSVQPGSKVSIDLFVDNLNKLRPNSYSANTVLSMAQNLASSWKQAGFIQGKVKNIRVEPVISHRVACFGLFLAYLNGTRGEFLWHTPCVESLCLSESQLKSLALESARQDLMQYQSAGSVTSISFKNLLNTLGIDDNTNGSIA